MTKIDPNSYNVTIRMVMDDGENCFEARTREFPDLAEYADTATEAYALVVEAIEGVIQDCESRGKDYPLPLSAPTVTDYSGRVTLRIVPWLHQALAENAGNAGVSLNHYISTELARHAGHRIGHSEVLRSMRGAGMWHQETILASEHPRPKLTVLENTNYPADQNAANA